MKNPASLGNEDALHIHIYTITLDDSLVYLDFGYMEYIYTVAKEVTPLAAPAAANLIPAIAP